MGKADKRLGELEEALEESERKRRKLKKRVDRLEEAVEELVTLLEDDEDEDSRHEPDEVGEPVHSVAPSGHRELSEPDDTWTVARLREAATSRGLTGVSRMTKAELLAAVSTAD